jgi:ankyrin repeat protein
VVGEQGLEALDKDGWTALHFAADEGHEQIIKFLLSHGAQANSQDGDGVTPLMQASLQGYLNVVQQLLQVVGNPGLEEGDRYGRTTLHHAAEGGHADVMSYLLSHGAQANIRDGQGMTPLMMASWEGHIGGLQKLLSVVGDEGLADTDENGWKALHYAADGDHGEVVKFLVSKGAQANSKNNKGQTPLMHASWKGHLRTVQKLVEVGGAKEQGLEERSNDGWTALHYAARTGHEEVMSFLLRHGAQANIRDGQGVTPLMVASWEGHMGGVRALLRHRNVQELNERKADGQTALHMACVTSYAKDAEVAKEIVRALLLAGADPTVVDDEGDTPRAFAEADGYTEVVPMFEVSSQRVSISHVTSLS